MPSISATSVVVKYAFVDVDADVLNSTTLSEIRSKQINSPNLADKFKG